MVLSVLELQADSKYIFFKKVQQVFQTRVKYIVQ